MSVDGLALRVVAAPGEANQLAISGGGSLRVTDLGAPLAAGPGCASAADGSTECAAPLGTPALTRIEVDAGDLDDSVSVQASLPARILRRRGRRSARGRRRRRPARWRRRHRLRGRWRGRRRDRPARRRLGQRLVRVGPRQRRRGDARRTRPGLRARGLRPAWPGRPDLAGHGRRTLGADPGPDLGTRGPAHPRRRALPDPPLPGADHRGLRNHRPRAVRRAPARPRRGHRARPGRHLGRRVRLARWAEPRQNHPRAPFRWVGWNGDFNHGHPSVCKPSRGCAPHLHLSWAHSRTPPRRVARSVWVFAVR